MYAIGVIVVYFFISIVSISAGIASAFLARRNNKSILLYFIIGFITCALLLILASVFILLFLGYVKA